jgi:hypothetical protein
MWVRALSTAPELSFIRQHSNILVKEKTMYRLIVRYHSNYYTFTHQHVRDWVDTVDEVKEYAKPFSKNYYSTLVIETKDGGSGLLKY